MVAGPAKLPFLSGAASAFIFGGASKIHSFKLRPSPWVLEAGSEAIFSTKESISRLLGRQWLAVVCLLTISSDSDKTVSRSLPNSPFHIFTLFGVRAVGVDCPLEYKVLSA